MRVPDLARVHAEFRRNFAERGDLGASLSVWLDGEELVSMADGFLDRERTRPWTAQTPVLFWSATKGPASACLLHACQQHGIRLSEPVAAFWPEFARSGKERITLEEVLSHQAGLPALSLSASVLDYPGVIHALEAEAPHWPRGEGHGYHPRTFGFLLDELVHRISGASLQQYWNREFAAPLDLALWIGVPPAVLPSVAPIFAAREFPKADDPFQVALLTPGSLTSRSFTSPKGLHSASAMNLPEARQLPLPAFGGIGTASSLAKFYSVCANGGTYAGRRYFTAPTLRQMSATVISGEDRVLRLETAFSAGFMKDPIDSHGYKRRSLFGPSLTAFGQPGAGGSLAFADPENHLAFAYVMNQMNSGVLPNSRSLSILDAIYHP